MSLMEFKLIMCYYPYLLRLPQQCLHSLVCLEFTFILIGFELILIDAKS